MCSSVCNKQRGDKACTLTRPSNRHYVAGTYALRAPALYGNVRRLEMATCIVIYGAKAAGKTSIAKQLVQELGAVHIDPDELVPEWLEEGIKADIEYGWMEPVLGEIMKTATLNSLVVVEATGGYETDWILAKRIEEKGIPCLSVYVSVPLEESLSRLALRTEERVPITDEEARAIHRNSLEHLSVHRTDLFFDSTEQNYREKAIEEIKRELSIKVNTNA